MGELACKAEQTGGEAQKTLAIRADNSDVWRRRKRRRRRRRRRRTKRGR
jgi:hypothetical protein